MLSICLGMVARIGVVDAEPVMVSKKIKNLETMRGTDGDGFGVELGTEWSLGGRKALDDAPITRTGFAAVYLAGRYAGGLLERRGGVMRESVTATREL